MVRPLVDGILVLNKPQGVTSMDMVRMAKRVTRVKRVGHAGTLDPIATGLLPICFGQATRLMEYLVDGRKVYRASFTLGAATDTYDALGEVTERGDASGVTREDVEALLPGFTGAVTQQPPMFSALKHEGKRLYELAREGIEVERPARDVVVHSIDILGWEPPTVELEVTCGRGFYMRTLANDLGIALGCYAHLSALVRTSAGPFVLADAHEPQELEEAGDEWRELLVPPDAALVRLEAIVLEPAAERHLRNGQAVSVPAAGVYAKHLDERRAYSTAGLFLGIVRFSRPDSMWQPEKVFALSEPSRLAPVA
ncbi:MAG: tRNA pseudouridine(55) synthase TruB [Chloroflexi bacterium]|nr:tRNA pseudouridine(55) synthase TruB [Chloroflexota bacterium]